MSAIINAAYAASPAYVTSGASQSVSPLGFAARNPNLFFSQIKFSEKTFKLVCAHPSAKEASEAAS